PDVVDRFHVKPALLHQRVAVFPAEAHQANPALDTQARGFEPLDRLGHTSSGAHRVVDHDHRLAGIDLALDEFAGAVLLPLLANQETSIAAVDRKSTRLNSSHVEISYAVFCL